MLRCLTNCDRFSAVRDTFVDAANRGSSGERQRVEPDTVHGMAYLDAVRAVFGKR